MPRAKHGNYDDERGLPDNTGQPQGSGIIVWLHTEICERLGDEAGHALIMQSQAHGSQNRAWLCAQLREAGHADLVDAYEGRRKQDAAAARRREKERMIAMCEATIARGDTPPGHQAYLRRQIAKARKYLEARDEQH